MNKPETEQIRKGVLSDFGWSVIITVLKVNPSFSSINLGVVKQLASFLQDSTTNKPSLRCTPLAKFGTTRANRKFLQVKIRLIDCNQDATEFRYYSKVGL